MCALQSEPGPFVMIKQRGFPYRSVMTAGASRVSGLRKLQAVNIHVAGIAFRKRRLEIHVDESAFGFRRLMATATLRRFVGTGQRKRSFRMIVVREFSPRLGGVTNLAQERGSIRLRPLHELVELAFMRIFMTTLASHAFPVVLRSWFRFEIRRIFVTVAAGNGRVVSTETKGIVVMSAQAESRWEKPLQVVAIFATVEAWGRGKLPGMFVGVTIRAISKLQRIHRGFALWNMALCALQRGMLSLQRVGSRRVLFQAEGRWLKTIDRVAV
jgi:hypothetical protein